MKVIEHRLVAAYSEKKKERKKIVTPQLVGSHSKLPD